VACEAWGALLDAERGTVNARIKNLESAFIVFFLN